MHTFGRDSKVICINRFDNRRRVVTKFTVKVVNRLLHDHVDRSREQARWLLASFLFSRPCSVEHELAALAHMSYCPFHAGVITARATSQHMFYLPEMPETFSLRMLLSEGVLTEALARFYICEVILAIEHMHNRDYTFVNLQLDNLFIASDGHIKLLHFGLCNTEVIKQRSDTALNQLQMQLQSEMHDVMSHG